MDSGNSGSLQSSSGGDDEYDSRAAGSIFIPQPPPLFDPLSQLHNPNMAWSRPAYPRSDPNPAPRELTNPYMPCFQPPPPENNNPGAVAPAAQNPTRETAAARNPKKRSRASRRAPTTVLTTDTTNFRAMVQEFTGIPAPPFNNNNNNNNNLSFPRINRPDIFGPPYLRRPFAQKAQTTPFLASSTNNNISSSSTIPINYQIPLITQNSNNLFSSLLQTNPKFIFPNSSSVMASKPQNQGSFEIGPGLDEFGSGQGNNITTTLNDLPNLISSEQISARNDGNNNTENENAARWRNNYGVIIGPNEGHDGNYQAQMKPVNGGYEISGPENVATKGEGMVESWIYSSE